MLHGCSRDSSTAQTLRWVAGFTSLRMTKSVMLSGEMAFAERMAPRSRSIAIASRVWAPSRQLTFISSSTYHSVTLISEFVQCFSF